MPPSPLARLRRVALAAVAATLAAAAPAAAAPIGAFTARGAWSFKSAKRLHPPKLRTDAHTAAAQLAPGYFLLDTLPNVGASGPMTGQGGPLILDTRLQPVWLQPVNPHLVSADLQQETYQGQPVLVWWQGIFTGTGAVTKGEVLVVDQHYRRVAALKAKAPWIISLHDAQIVGTHIWVTVYRYVRNQNLKRYGGSSKGTLYDAGVQEYDLTTGNLLYTWDALKSVPLADSQQPASTQTAPGSAWDAYHLNTVQVLPSNQILISMRNTWAGYLIDTTTNRIVWTLGGRHSSFKIAPNARFTWQHHMQLLPNDELTLYDDDCCKILPNGDLARPNGRSQGLVLQLDPTNLTASLVASYRKSPRPRSAAFLGSMQLLPNGNALVGWGSLPYFSEYTASGRLILDAIFPGKDQSYRALFSSTWVGTPSFPPSGAVRPTRGKKVVYASWNGATRVATWEVFAGPSAKHLKPVVTKARSGFETAIAVKPGYKAFRVRALDAQGNVLGTSHAFSG